MKKLNRLFAILIAVLGVSATAKADTSILQASDGWQKITALPGNLGDYYYVFVDNDKDLMMTLGTGANQGNQYKTMWYRTSNDPVADLNKVWILESNTAKGNVSIRNVAYDHLCLQTEWNAAWNFRTHDNGGTNTGVNVSWTGFTLAYASNKWSLQNGNYPEAGYVGPWSNSIVDGAETAANKTGNAIGYFQVYAISKSDFHNLYVKANTTEGEEINLDMSVFVGNPKIEGKGALWSSTTGCGCNYTTNKQDGTTGGFLENWSGSGPIGKMYQTITGLPNGVYELKMKAFRNNNLSGGDAVYVFANADKTQVTTDDVTTYYTVRTTLTSGTLELGLKQEKAGSQWIGLDEVSLTYLGVDLSELTALVQGKYDELNNLSRSEVPAAFADMMTTLLNKFKTLPKTESGLNDANNEIGDFITTYHAVSGAYMTLQTLISTCENNITNSNETISGAKSAFTAAISTAKADVAAATTVDAINSVYNTLEAARQAYVMKADPTNGTFFDYTFKISNPAFDNETTAGWTSEGAAQNKNIARNKTNGIIDGPFFENWNPSNFNGSIHQTISGLPSGKYQLTVAAFGTGTHVFANDTQVEVTSNDGLWYEIDIVVNGSLKFGIKNESATNWMGIDNASLKYKGFDVETAQNGIASLKSQAQAIVTKPMNASIRTALYNAISNTQDYEDSDDRNELNGMIDGLNVAIENANASIADYEKINAYITKANNIHESIAASYITPYNDGTISGNAEAIHQELNVATANYVAANFKNEIQLTEWGAESNAMWSASGEHWDGTTGEGCTSYYDANGTNTTHTLSKTVELTPGTYVFRGAGRTHPNTTLSLSVDIDGIEPAIFTAKNNSGRGIDKEGNATFADDAQYAKDGEGQGWEWEFIKFTLNETTTVTLTATCQSTGWGWASFANNGLWMDDATYLTANAGAFTTPKAKAEELVAKPMGATEKEALTAAIEKANGTIDTPAKLNAAIEALNNAIADAEPSIAKYEKVASYIAKANKIDSSIAAEYQSQYNAGTLSEDTETIFQSLEVATYNYVETTFPYHVEKLKADGWNSKGTNTAAATFSNEHWSGETREYKNQQDGNNWGWGAEAWTIDFDQDVTLPKGEYVFKVAGRKSGDATLELTVTMGGTVLGTVNDFPSTNEALGINKTGVASFDANDPAGFAKDGKGYGWQWRYVKFVLNEESTVKVAVHAEANAIHQWVSFGDYTLHMDESAYLEANKGGLDAPTAAAQALVTAVPMGAEEIAALNQALAMTYTTGAEMFAKVNALNEAVANANAWVPKYNEAKLPLVAALERFEADYNDAQNGVLGHLYMCKSLWTAAISMAQAAAEAKDVTNSYDGFEEATKNLNDALDAVTRSDGEYEALDAAIKAAKPLYEGNNFGNNAFQIPASAKENLNTTNALAVYNAATADGDAVTSVTASLNSGINTTLNAPADGQRFYIKVATDGHGKYGNAVLATLGATGANNPTGYGLNANNAVKAHLNQAFIFTQVEGNLYNISIERAEGTVYLTYGALNGSAAGWKNQQIQATTDTEKKGEFKIEATAKNGVLKIKNTIDNNYLDCQNGGSIYTDTGIENEEFAFELASENTVSLKFSSVGWATLILPFNATLPEGVKALSCGEADGETLTLIEAESIKANTPYLMNGYEGTHVFSGYGMAEKDSYTDGLFVGTYEEYKTTANSNTYVLQKKGDEVAFYLVGESGQPTVGANRCYMVYEGAAGAPKFRLGRGNTTGIDNAEPAIDNEVVIYDLMGRKVTTMEKGGMYIVNGKKVVIK